MEVSIGGLPSPNTLRHPPTKICCYFVHDATAEPAIDWSWSFLHTASAGVWGRDTEYMYIVLQKEHFLLDTNASGNSTVKLPDSFQHLAVWLFHQTPDPGIFLEFHQVAVSIGSNENHVSAVGSNTCQVPGWDTNELSTWKSWTPKLSKIHPCKSTCPNGWVKSDSFIENHQNTKLNWSNQCVSPYQQHTNSGFSMFLQHAWQN